MNIHIRKMVINDLLSIKNILNSEFDNFWTYTMLEQELKSANSYVFVAISENKIVGFSAIQIVVDSAELMNIVVKKGCRNCGVATALLSYLIDFISVSNLVSITLEVNSNNTIALSLYEKFLFKKVGTRKRYYNNIDDAILMTRFNL